jgi:hypothetical protein
MPGRLSAVCEQRCNEARRAGWLTQSERKINLQGGRHVNSSAREIDDVVAIFFEFFDVARLREIMKEVAG